ncbi:MAG: choice-of-anchor Q domain-containing protein, partial [Chthoniobacterales bacterium]
GNVSALNNPSNNHDGGGGIFVDDRVTSPPIVQNSIISGNTGPTGPDVSGAFVSNGYNIIGNTANSTGFGATGDQLNVNPLLDPNGLKNNGGATLTVALRPGSPAIDAGKNTLAVDGNGIALTSDQRAGAFQRVVNGKVDIGAFEVQPPPNTLPGNNVTKTSAAGDASVTFPKITRAGLTRFSAISPASAGALPPGYTLQTTLPAYDINTTAEFTPPILVSFTVPATVSQAQFKRLRILHGEGGALVDRTVLAPKTPAPNFATRTIYARVDSLSPFVLAIAPPQLQNISTRLRVQTGDNVLIGGFIVSGSVPKKVILRGLGPSLTQFGVMDALANPTMELRNGAGMLLASNDNWRMDQEQAIIDSQLPPSNNLESAIVRNLAPGNYTTILRSKTGTPGVGLVEVYDLEPDSGSELGNISTRGFVQTGEDVMIGGFIVGPSASGSTRVIVRALGPDLANFGVTDVLPDPTLEIRNVSGIVASNDNWRSDQEGDIIDSGFAPREDLESAVIADLPPGNYTAIVRGKDNSTGVGLVEVFTLR